MANVKERIDNLKEYFLGMDVKENVISVAVQFPRKWVIIDGLEEKYGIVVDPCKNTEGSPYEDKPNSYYFAASLTDGFDVLFDAIEENVSVMISAEERIKLLDEKIKEIKELFDDEDNSLEKLRTLEFTFQSSFRSNKKPKAKQVVSDNGDNNEENVEEI